MAAITIENGKTYSNMAHDNFRTNLWPFDLVCIELSSVMLHVFHTFSLMRLRVESKQRGGFLIDRHLNKKIFPVCLILHIRESGFAHILALLFINGVFTGAAAGVMTSICVFLCGNTWDFTTYANSLQSCQISGSILCLLCCEENILWQQKKQKKPLHCQQVII